METTLDQNFMDQNTIFSSTGSHTTSFNIGPEEDSTGEFDFSDVVLKYINQILMEDTTEERNCLIQDSSALQAAEKPFYEMLGEKYPTSPDCNTEVQVENFTHYSSCNNAVETNWIDELGKYISLSNTQSFPNDYTFQATPELSYNHSNGFSSVVERLVEPSEGKVQLVSDAYCESELIRQLTPRLSYNHSSGINSVVEGPVKSPVGNVQVPDVYCESELEMQYRKGVEEANKFLPNGNNLILNFESKDFLRYDRNKEASDVVVELEKKDGNGSRRKKNVHREDGNLEEGRNYKQLAAVEAAMFDMVLVNGENEEQAESTIRKSLKVEASKNLQQNGGKSHGKKQTSKTGTVDLWSLLIQCAQAVATDDRRIASELLKQLRQHSSPSGDGLQRLANCFTDGLEARLAGSGSQIYSTLPQKSPSSVADMLKAYQLFMTAIPFKKISNFFANQTINDLAENATSLHIVDFGILYGFQWPCLIQCLSKRKGGPPKLRITGIELPRPGFRPAERVEETGCRLRDYAKELNVPFEYHAIAQKWETIQLEDLKIKKDELLVANCLFRARNLLDESVILDSPRDAVLNLIRKMNPDLFIHGILNGTYNSPFFVTRFREALFHFSTLFDVLETIIPRENIERMTIERDLLGKEAMNIIACEGSNRVERP
ncbi:scarecrow-like protein 14 [Papaver somniferum]|uniref:scarecrow-like protein 14 n=1 Tax=Papaver somniferum TaxID=3469 RepID=UPI000E6F9A6B|nr:scarecrow-like protein 14 [Papaver somniferum]